MNGGELAAYSCRGSYGMGLLRTVFPVRPFQAPSSCSLKTQRRGCQSSIKAKSCGARQPVSRVLSTRLRGLDGHSSGTSVTGCLARPTRMAGRKPPRLLWAGRHPYLVLLPVGFALPPLLPEARCALTAPFHPYRRPCGRRRFVFCGTVPGVAPAGRYPAPCIRGARTFLDIPFGIPRPSSHLAPARAIEHFRLAWKRRGAASQPRCAIWWIRLVVSGSAMPSMRAGRQ